MGKIKPTLPDVAESLESFRNRVLGICAIALDSYPDTMRDSGARPGSKIQKLAATNNTPIINTSNVGRVAREVMLYCTNPVKNSDKVYKITLVDSGTSVYNVIGSYGRRGGKLTDEIKASSVSLAAAQQAFNELMREKKTKKHYTENISGIYDPTEDTYYSQHGFI